MSLPSSLRSLQHLQRQLSRCSSARFYSTHEAVKRFAIIGSGPAACYTAMYLRRVKPSCLIDMYDRNPVPYGLVRYGVAPDHRSVKNVIFEFEQLGRSENFRFIGNVEVGKDLSLEDVKSAYDGVVFAYGASEDRKLGIPGEDTVKDVFSARDFVGWYNGYPGCEKLPIQLDDVEEVAIIGHGNVAMDCARVLLQQPSKFNPTDISEPALEQLHRSRVKFVRIIGRRGFVQSSFTAKELRDLFYLDKSVFVRDSFFEIQIAPSEATIKKESKMHLDRRQKRISEMWYKNMKMPRHRSSYPDIPANMRNGWTLNFRQSPTQFIPDNNGRLAAVELRKNKLVPHMYAPEAIAEPHEPEVLTRVTAHMALRSIGYKALPLPGMEELGIDFDERAGKITNFDGRVQDKEGNAVRGMYCSGWVKTGPIGVIAETLRTSYETGGTIIDDLYTADLPGLGGEGGWDALKKIVEDKGIRTTSWQDWQKIKEVENAGKRPRKIQTVREMLEIADRN